MDEPAGMQLRDRNGEKNPSKQKRRTGQSGSNPGLHPWSVPLWITFFLFCPWTYWTQENWHIFLVNCFSLLPWLQRQTEIQHSYSSIRSDTSVMGVCVEESRWAQHTSISVWSVGEWNRDEGENSPTRYAFRLKPRAAPKPQLLLLISGFRAARYFPDISQVAGEIHILHVTFYLTVTIKNEAVD